jgi:xanthine dehydrogenase small subunit
LSTSRRSAPCAAIRFLLGDRPVVLRDQPPGRTLLSWLREEARLTGTKEGCAEGDCGACTGGAGRTRWRRRVRWRAVNACLLLLPALRHRRSSPWKHLRGPDGAPHPVQQAMVEHHASQCGFCTRASSWRCCALHAGLGQRRDRARQAAEALAGNLCRCTGYRPILDAAVAAAPRRIAPLWRCRGAGGAG